MQLGILKPIAQFEDHIHEQHHPKAKMQTPQIKIYIYVKTELIIYHLATEINVNCYAT